MGMTGFSSYWICSFTGEWMIYIVTLYMLFPSIIINDSPFCYHRGPSLDGISMVILALVLFPSEMLMGEARDL